MKKVVYSVTKIGRKENTQLKGFGYITEEDLVIASISKSGKPFIREFEDCVRRCAPNGKTGEFKGTYSKICDVQFETKDGNYETRECEITYLIWYKIAQ